MYTDLEYYLKNAGVIPSDMAVSWLEKASTYIDVLTFNRIKSAGFEKLHKWQQTIIQQIVCAYADWLYENQDMLSTYLKSYAINGVVMTMDGAWNVYIEQGVAMRSDLYYLLESTGLCTRSYNWGRYMHYG